MQPIDCHMNPFRAFFTNFLDCAPQLSRLGGRQHTGQLQGASATSDPLDDLGEALPRLPQGLESLVGLFRDGDILGSQSVCVCVWISYKRYQGKAAKPGLMG